MADRMEGSATRSLRCDRANLSRAAVLQRRRHSSYTIPYLVRSSRVLAMLPRGSHVCPSGHNNAACSGREGPDREALARNKSWIRNPCPWLALCTGASLRKACAWVRTFLRLHQNISSSVAITMASILIRDAVCMDACRRHRLDITQRRSQLHASQTFYPTCP